ncbi:hypothetical protein [Pseudomonas batumici]|uniref:hypothetical protein n=1 Tax=Pseudomonas batumici TaxID=226910 RepID=UPI0012EE21D4|nr:hypothetical protein [Pseudomonas batumici]
MVLMVLSVFDKICQSIPPSPWPASAEGISKCSGLPLDRQQMAQLLLADQGFSQKVAFAHDSEANALHFDSLRAVSVDNGLRNIESWPRTVALPPHRYRAEITDGPHAVAAGHALARTA